MVQPRKVDPNLNSIRYSNADNDSDAREVFKDREKYANFIFPAASSLGVGTAYNFWGKDRFFGKINPVGNPAIVIESRLRQLRHADPGQTFYALDFVADAWRDFCDRINLELANGTLYDSGPYSSMTVKRGWTDVYKEYHNYMVNDLYPAFQNIFMSSPKRKRMLTDFDTFLEVFDEFSGKIIKNAGPITLSGFVESLYYSPLNTGLALEIATDAHDDDLRKEIKFLYDENFPLVMKLATYYGFSVDKNAPCRFVIDPSSLAAQEYMLGLFMESGDLPPQSGAECEDGVFIPKNRRSPELFGYSEIPGFEDVIRHAPGYAHYQDQIGGSYSPVVVYTGLFNASYLETITDDMNLLKVYLFDFYNRYVSANASLLIPAGTIDDCDKPRTILRDLVNPEILSLYGDKWSLRATYVLRRRERGIVESRDNEIKDLRDIFNFYDFMPSNRNSNKYLRALGYINEKFIGRLTTSSFDTNIIS